MANVICTGLNLYWLLNKRLCYCAQVKIKVVQGVLVVMLSDYVDIR